MIRTMTLAACMLFGLAACDQTGEPEPTDGAAGGAVDAAAEGDGPGLALAQAQVEAIKAQVASDTENCAMPEGSERWNQVIDLGGGVGAVVMQCSAGMPDMWNQLFIVQEGGGHHMAVPLFQYDIQGDGEWRAEFAQPNLEWDPANRTFFSGINGDDGCGSTTTWRWDEAEQHVAMVRATVQDCEGVTDEASLPEPRTIWPTTPPTPEPGTV